MAVFDSSSEFSASGGAFTIVSGGHEIITIDNTGLFFVFAVTPITAVGDVGVTENGNAMVLAYNADSGPGNFSLFVFRRTGLVGTGFHTVTTTFVSGRDAFAGVGVSYTKVFSGAMLRLGPALNTNSAAPSVTMAPALDEVAFALLGLRDDTIAVTEAPGQTTIRSANAGGAGGVRMHVANRPGDITTVLSEGLGSAANLILLGLSVVDVGGGVFSASGFAGGASTGHSAPNGTYTGAGRAIGAADAFAHPLVPTTITGSGIAYGTASMSGDVGTLSRNAKTLDDLLLSLQNDVAMLKRAQQAHTGRLNRLDSRVGP